MIFEIVGHSKTYDAIMMDSGYYETRTVVKIKLITTIGWQLKFKWDSGETSYIALKDIK